MSKKTIKRECPRCQEKKIKRFKIRHRWTKSPQTLFLCRTCRNIFK